jgi:hypothetical protein
MLVPDFGQHGTAGLLQDRSSLFLFCREGQRPAPLTPFAKTCFLPSLVFPVLIPASKHKRSPSG